PEVNTLAEEMKSINWTSFYSSIDDEQSETLSILLINLAQQYHAGRELTPIGHVNYEAFKVYDFVNRYSLNQESDKVGISIQTTIPGSYLQPPYQSTKEVLALSDPFDVVTLSSSANTSTEGLPTIPIALVYKMIHQKESERIIDQAWLTLDVATMLLGVGEISLALKSPQIVTKVTRILLGAADLTATATDIYCNGEVDSELCEEWREWGVYIQLGLIGASGFDQIKSLLGRSDDFLIYLNKLDGYENLRNLKDQRIVNKLENWTDDQLKLLDSDLSSSSLHTSFMYNPELVDAWRYVSDLKTSGTSKLTQDVDFLQVVNRQRGNSDLINKIGSDKYDDIIKNYAGQCKGCDAPASSASEAVKHLPPHDGMLENLEDFTTKHHEKDGFDKVVHDLKSTDPRKQKGAEFVTRILKDQDDISAFEFKYLDDYDNTADFVFSGTKVDGKSWSVTGSIDNIGGWDLSKQLKDYFNDGDFEMWFDYSRFQKSANSAYSSMSKAEAAKHIKEQYQKLFSKNEYAAYDALEGSTWFDVQGIENMLDFKEAVNDVTDDFYSFIHVK
ncbi:MAG: hypothetical protein RJQ14_09195, partial [Marinoscillum sp.]